MPSPRSIQRIRRRYLEILRAKSLEFGSFTLVSGQTSNYYFDAKKTTLDAEGAYLGACLVLEELRVQAVEVEAIGGLTLGADPIVSAVAAVSFAEPARYRPLSAFIARKEPKKHGTRSFIEGFQGSPGAPVAVIDDVCTTGGSTLRAVRAAEDAGFRVAAVLCLVDRGQGGERLLRDYPFFRLVTAEELLDDPEVRRRLAEGR